MPLNRDELRAKMAADFAKMRTEMRREAIWMIYAAVVLFVVGITLGFYFSIL